ncbi:uncharacterized protein LOC127730156 [Mytilus californianus]|uniref:uncharacterized protein LOC127730156 n=1 Tax=Mytilus californianus TaxID=6549 RepID=UPI00224558E1|nr:uncharacterized protein LOC127730156 [Mytilus californianus]
MVSLGQTSIRLLVNRFKKTFLYNKAIENVIQLYEFWEIVGGFLAWVAPKSSSDSDAEEEGCSIEFFESSLNEENGITENQRTSIDLFESGSLDALETPDTKSGDDTLGNIAAREEETSGTSYNSDQNPDYPVSSDGEMGDKQDTVSRDELITSLSSKMVAFKVLDVFSLHPPPPSYRVREVDPNFVKALMAKMIEKNSVAVENAPNIVGFVDVDLQNFRIEKLSTYRIHVIDGNHSLKAQKAAYRKTKDPTFRFRGVNIYCDLNEDEALFLGVSRNEDTSSFVKFSDYQKVDLIRRKLYSMTRTSQKEEPPKTPKGFKNMFACMLNLKEKNAVDGKNIIKFLACLPNNSYILYKDICSRKPTLPASKFTCLRGLTDSDAYVCLHNLSLTELEKKDWQYFASSCLQRQKKVRKHRKDVTARIEFSDTSTKIYVNQKPMPGSCLCFKFTWDQKEVTLTSEQLQDKLFGLSNKKKIESATYERIPVRFQTCSQKNIDFIKKTNEIEERPLKGISNIFSLDDIYSNSEQVELSDEDEDDETVIPDSPNETGASSNGYSITRFTSRSSQKKQVKASPLMSSTLVDTLASDQESENLNEYNDGASSSNIDILNKDSTIDGLTSYTDLNLEEKRTSKTSDEFIKIIVDEAANMKAKLYGKQIEEDEVETRPDMLYNHMEVLLDPVIQEMSKKYFTDDAWMVVTNVLNILQAYKCKQIERNKEMDKVLGSNKGKALCGTKGTNCFKNRKDVGRDAKSSSKSEDISKKNVEFTKTGNTSKRKKSLKRKRDVYSFSSNDSPVKAFEIPVVSIPAIENEVKIKEKPQGSSVKKELRIRLTDINTVTDIGKYTASKTAKQSKGKWKKD